MWTDGWVALDTETTGFGSKARIVELACVTYERGEVVREWTQLLYPEDVDWSDRNVMKALEVNGIKHAELVGKPTFRDVLGDLLVELSHPVWVAHNASFDISMMNQELQRLGHPALSPQLLICTKNLASGLNNTAVGNRLSDVACRYNVLQEGAHRAAADAITCSRVLARMVEQGLLPSDDDSMKALCMRNHSNWQHKHRW